MSSSYLTWKDGVFIASCVVTDKAKKKWIKFVKDTIKELDTSEKIFISWCWAFKDWRAQSDFFELYPELSEYKTNIEILWEDPRKKASNK
jgi:tRNA A37 methylthiotransferase MiaB